MQKRKKEYGVVIFQGNGDECRRKAVRFFEKPVKGMHECDRFLEKCVRFSEKCDKGMDECVRSMHECERFLEECDTSMRECGKGTATSFTFMHGCGKGKPAFVALACAIVTDMKDFDKGMNACERFLNGNEREMRE